LLQFAIAQGITNPPGASTLHGETHWKAVALMGLHLARLTPDADVGFIYAFACLHDLMRQDDGLDPEHGQRAAGLFTEIVERRRFSNDFPPADSRTNDLHYAIANHVGTPHARAHANVNVGLCWDADRLNLWRVAIIPDDQYLSTNAALLPGAKELGLELCVRQMRGMDFPSWAEIRKLLSTWRFP
jgi:uncharacterized protein